MNELGHHTRVGPICRTVEDVAKVLDVIAGYDPKDELTAFSVGRMPCGRTRASRMQAPRRRAHRRVREYMDASCSTKPTRRASHRRRGDRRPAGARRHHRRPGPQAGRCSRRISTSTRRAPSTSCSSAVSPRRFPWMTVAADDGPRRHLVDMRENPRSRRISPCATSWRATRSTTSSDQIGELRLSLELYLLRTRRREDRDAQGLCGEFEDLIPTETPPPGSGRLQ